MAFWRTALADVSRSLLQALPDGALQTVPQQLALDNEPLQTVAARPAHRQIGAVEAEPVLDTPATIDDALQECLQQRLRPSSS